jgi:hypothetical protein
VAVEVGVSEDFPAANVLWIKIKAFAKFESNVDKSNQVLLNVNAEFKRPLDSVVDPLLERLSSKLPHIFRIVALEMLDYRFLKPGSAPAGSVPISIAAQRQSMKYW